MGFDRIRVKKGWIRPNLGFGRSLIYRNKDIKLIEHTCKTNLTYNNKIWIKKDVSTLFDVPIGSIFGIDLCDLVGLYIIHRHKSIYNANELGLYRDDGLAIIER